MKDHYKRLKTLVEQLKSIKKNLKKGKRTKKLKKGLKTRISWFSDFVFEELAPDEMASGYLDTLRSELKERKPLFIFGGMAVRRLRSQLKSFGNQQKVLRNASPNQIFGWMARKRSFTTAGYNVGGKYDKAYDAKKKGNSSSKKF